MNRKWSRMFQGQELGNFIEKRQKQSKEIIDQLKLQSKSAAFDWVTLEFDFVTLRQMQA